MVLTTELPLVAKDELVSITDSQGHEFEQALAVEERGAWAATFCGIVESDTI